MWISWKHEDTDFSVPLTFEQKIDIFCEQTLGWQLHIADLVANGGTTFGEFKLEKNGYAVPSIRHSGFAVLHICLSYIKFIGSFLKARPQSSSNAFKTGMLVVPGLIDPSSASAVVLSRLYKGARCGLYYEGRTRPGIGLGTPPDGNAISYAPKSDMIGISPERLPRVLKTHLELRRELLTPRIQSFVSDSRLALIQALPKSDGEGLGGESHSDGSDSTPNQALQLTASSVRCAPASGSR